MNLKWAYKNCENFNIYNVAFKKKTPGDIIILHLWSNILDDMIYSSWDIECGSLGKMKKIAGDIICNMCIKNHNHMQHGSWDMEWDRKNFLSFWAIFCPFAPPPPLKIKIFVYQNSLSYDYCFLKYRVQQTIFCHFGLLLPPNSPKNQN